MAHAVARIGDPLSHGGQVVQGSARMFANGKAVARVGDQAICAAHGLVTITTGSTTWFDPTNGKAVARVTSQCSCGALIISGSETVFSNT